jgi:hypothetical protein
MRRALVQLPAQGDFVMGLSPSARELPITLELPASLQREIGKVVTRHATVELKLSRIVYILLGIDAVSGRISVREPRTTDRLDMIADLLKINKIKVQANLPAIRTDLDKCSLERDRLHTEFGSKIRCIPENFSFDLCPGIGLRREHEKNQNAVLIQKRKNTTPNTQKTS